MTKLVPSWTLRKQPLSTHKFVKPLKRELGAITVFRVNVGAVNDSLARTLQNVTGISEDIFESSHAT